MKKRITRLPVNNATDALAGYEQLQRVLRRHLPPSTVSLYAQPQPASDGMVEWYTELGGQPVPFSELNEKEATHVRRLLDERLASVEQAAANLRLTGTEGETVRQLLRQAARYPQDDHIYVLNGQPVITAWGAPPPPVQTATPPPVMAAPVPAKKRRGWLWLLLLLLLLALLAVLLWWWFCRDKAEVSTELPPVVEAVLPVEEVEETTEPPAEEPEEKEELVKALPAEPEAAVEETSPEEPVVEEEPTPVPEPEPKPAPPPPVDPLAQARQRLDQAGRDCSALEQLQRNDRQIRNTPALQQQLQQRLMQHCRQQMIAKARDMCPEERPKELAPEMVIVFDASGSMDISLQATPEEIRRAGTTQGLADLLSQAILGTNAPNTSSRVFREPKRITAARQATSTVVEQLPSDVNAGLVLVESCPAARSVGFFPPGKRNELIGRIRNITPVEGTPLADGIAKAGALLDGVNRESVILVVSDGEESCGQDPCAVARQLARRKPHLRINVVDILGSGAGNCLAQATGGKVYTANNVQELQSMTARAAQDVLLPAHCRK